MPAFAAAPVQEPGFELRDVWLKYRVAYHRPKTLRGFVAGGLLLRTLRGQARLRTQHSADFWALRGISLQAKPGEVVGIIGSNGAGKSTLLQVLARIMKPDKGTAIVHGTIGTLLSFGAGFNLELTGRENVFMNAAILGLTRAEIRERLGSIVELADIGDFFDAPVGTYSSGMRARLGFSVAAHINPDVLLIDEVIQAGDISFQRRAGNVLDRFRDQRKVIALVTHSAEVTRRYCSRTVWMEAGDVRMDGPTEDVLREYRQWSESRTAPVPSPE